MSGCRINKEFQAEQHKVKYISWLHAPWKADYFPTKSTIQCKRMEQHSKSRIYFKVILFINYSSWKHYIPLIKVMCRCCIWLSTIDYSGDHDLQILLQQSPSLLLGVKVETKVIRRSTIASAKPIASQGSTIQVMKKVSSNLKKAEGVIKLYR